MTGLIIGEGAFTVETVRWMNRKLSVAPLAVVTPKLWPCVGVAVGSCRSVLSGCLILIDLSGALLGSMGSVPSTAGPPAPRAKCSPVLWVTARLVPPVHPSCSDTPSPPPATHPLWVTLSAASFQNHGRTAGAYLHRHQARRRAARHHWRDHQEVRDEGLQTCWHEDASGEDRPEELKSCYFEPRSHDCREHQQRSLENWLAVWSIPDCGEPAGPHCSF